MTPPNPTPTPNPAPAAPSPLTLTRASIARYTLNFITPVKTSGRTYSQRKGLILRLCDTEGSVGLGEAAPLPGMSAETLSQAEAALRQITAPKSALFSTAHTEDEDLLRAMKLELPPSAAHALDEAWWDLVAQRRKMPVAKLLGGGKARSAVPLHKLVADAEQAQKAVAAGFHVLKVKVGFATQDEDEARLAAIREAAGPQVALKLDANGIWGVDQACEALQAFSKYRLQCCEQPCPPGNLDALRVVRETTGVKIALDESVRSLADLEAALKAQAGDAIVIKPMLVGGLRAAVEMAKRAAEAEIAVFVTTSFEAVVGRAGALHVASVVPGELWSCGLDTGDLLANDLGHGPETVNGAMRVPQTPGLGVAFEIGGDS